MRLSHLMIAGMALAAAPALAEPKKPVSNWTCEEFLGVEADFQPKVVYYATAFPKSGKPTSLIDIEGTEKVAPLVIDECKKSPKDPFMTKLKNAWRAVEADGKKIKDKM
jgi:acid stress chaperone HdeA